MTSSAGGSEIPTIVAELRAAGHAADPHWTMPTVKQALLTWADQIEVAWCQKTGLTPEQLAYLYPHSAASIRTAFPEAFRGSETQGLIEKWRAEARLCDNSASGESSPVLQAEDRGMAVAYRDCAGELAAVIGTLSLEPEIIVSELHAGEDGDGPLESTDWFLNANGLRLLVNIPVGSRATFSLSAGGKHLQSGQVVAPLGDRGVSPQEKK